MYNSGVIKVYPDLLTDVSYVEFTPPPVKVAFTHQSLHQMHPDQVAKHLAWQMMSLYRELFETQWQAYLAQQQGPSLLIHTSPKDNGKSLYQIWKDEPGHWEKKAVPPTQYQFQYPFEKFFEAMMSKKKQSEDIDTVLEKGIPGFHQMLQRCPVETCKEASEDAFLRDTIIHLNDEHKWPREQIAEWLDTLDHDLQFKVPGGGEEDGSDH